jgi:hypothetical protein
MRGLFVGFAAFGLSCGVCAAQDVPLPYPRPSIQVVTEPHSFAEAAAGLTLPDKITSEPSPCRLRLDEIAVVEAVPHLIGPGACGGGDMVRVREVILHDKSRIKVLPAPELRCEMAESVAAWLRDDVAPEFSQSSLVSVVNYDSYECRGRNRVAGAKLSEHGKGDALDVRAFKLADGKVVDPTDVNAPHDLRDRLRTAACARFHTVLGPGSDGYHESHIHLDLAERRNGYRICQWDVRDPQPKEIARADIVPLPQPRPVLPPESMPANGKSRL